MVRHALTSIGTRFSAGHGLWSIVAFFFPAFAIVKDESVSLAMLLFLLETLLASALIAARVGVSRRAMRADAEAARRLLEALKVLLLFVLPFSLGCAVTLGVATFVEVDKGRATFDASVHIDRATWMAVALLASAVLDSVIAPVRSVTWLETGVAWQGSRTAVLFREEHHGPPEQDAQEQHRGATSLPRYPGLEPGHRAHRGDHRVQYRACEQRDGHPCRTIDVHGRIERGASLVDFDEGDRADVTAQPRLNGSTKSSRTLSASSSRRAASASARIARRLTPTLAAIRAEARSVSSRKSSIARDTLSSFTIANAGKKKATIDHRPWPALNRAPIDVSAAGHQLTRARRRPDLPRRDGRRVTARRGNHHRGQRGNGAAANGQGRPGCGIPHDGPVRRPKTKEPPSPSR